MNNFTNTHSLNITQSVVMGAVLLVAVFTATNFDTFAFAEEIIIPKAEFSLGANHLGSMIKTQTVSNDGSVWIFVTSTEPVEREHMTINVRFTDKNGLELIDVNYDILVSQNNQVILHKTMINQQIGIGDHLTEALPSNDEVSINITLHSIGGDSFAGTDGEIIETSVVPEFGAITPMILGISIFSIIMISAKNKGIFKQLISN